MNTLQSSILVLHGTPQNHWFLGFIKMRLSSAAESLVNTLLEQVNGVTVVTLPCLLYKEKASNRRGNTSVSLDEAINTRRILEPFQRTNIGNKHRQEYVTSERANEI